MSEAQYLNRLIDDLILVFDSYQYEVWEWDRDHGGDRIFNGLPCDPEQPLERSLPIWGNYIRARGSVLVLRQRVRRFERIDPRAYIG